MLSEKSDFHRHSYDLVFDIKQVITIKLYEFSIILFSQEMTLQRLDSEQTRKQHYFIQYVGLRGWRELRLRHICIVFQPEPKNVSKGCMNLIHRGTETRGKMTGWRKITERTGVPGEF